jgi:serine/threonine protein kinase
VIGQTVNNYEVTRLLGEGGMGAVYLAEHPFLKRKAAIKILKPECASNTDLVQRFLNEARAANAIHHPNIIDIIDVGILPEGVPYMMMEFLKGEALADRIRRTNRLPIEDALFIAGQIASALAAAHAVSIVHRDLKPDNIFLVPDTQNPEQERVKVLDFGIAKLRPEFAPGTPRTGIGELMGTPAYMSPEQCMGKTNEIDHRADIYALGVILYEMLCCRAPFEGPSFGEYFLQHVTVAPQPPRSLNPEIPAEIDGVILKALEKESANRFQTMDAFAVALAGKAQSSTLSFNERRPPRRPPRPPAEASSPLDQEPPEKHEETDRYFGGTQERSDESTPIVKAHHTTLSSMAGQMRTPRGSGSSQRRKRQITAIAGSAFVLFGLLIVGGVKYWGKPRIHQPTSSGHQSTSALPKGPSVAEPVVLPQLAPKKVEDVSNSTSPKAEEKEAEGKVIPPTDRTENQSAGKGASPTRHERSKAKAGGRGEQRVTEPISRHGMTEKPAEVPATLPPPPTTVPHPEAVESPKKIIKREKF